MACLEIDHEIRCRCGELGIITGIQGPSDKPEYVWVRHRLHLTLQTHIHGARQMKDLLAQTMN